MDRTFSLTEMMKPGAPDPVLVTSGGKHLVGPLSYEVDDRDGSWIYSIEGKTFREEDVATIHDEANIINLRRPGIVRMIADARAAGLEVTDAGAVCVIRRRGRGATRLDLWADGTATRGDIDLDLATEIRTIKSMRRILGLS